MSASLNISLCLVCNRLVAARHSVSGGARLPGERALKRVSYRFVLLVIEKVFLDLIVALSDFHLAIQNRLNVALNLRPRQSFVSSVEGEKALAF